ncbi:hypothetical protein FN846DRAFT_984307 [Sphaerosporella brunnea]|uniref:Uncharacterized protein n=1 Tax=Sphaerosporella brunnea TaxID=1250544 RepID=A0A5J5EUM7_9PEZI|nr:hypothetical protein FN846DRAFT_984307 [Sphaerosporella brunnea]
MMQRHQHPNPKCQALRSRPPPTPTPQKSQKHSLHRFHTISPDASFTNPGTDNHPSAPSASKTLVPRSPSRAHSGPKGITSGAPGHMDPGNHGAQDTASSHDARASGWLGWVSRSDEGEAAKWELVGIDEEGAKDVARLLEHLRVDHYSRNPLSDKPTNLPGEASPVKPKEQAVRFACLGETVAGVAVLSLMETPAIRPAWTSRPDRGNSRYSLAELTRRSGPSRPDIWGLPTRLTCIAEPA